MSIENFEILDIEPNDNYIEKRGFLKLYHQQAANLKDSDENIEVTFDESNNYHQIGNVDLQY